MGAVLVGNGTLPVLEVDLTASDVGAADATHTHAEGDVTGLTAALAAKAPLNSPTLVTPALGTPSSGTLTNCTGLPVSGLTAVPLVVSVDYFKCYKSTDHTSIGTSFANITGLSLGTLANGVMYGFCFYLWMDSDATTTGIDVTVNSATALTLARYSVTYWTTANASTVRGFDGAWQGDTASTASNGTAVRLYKVEGMVQLNGSGSLEAQAKREAVGSGPNCRAGSYGEAWKLG